MRNIERLRTERLKLGRQSEGTRAAQQGQQGCWMNWHGVETCEEPEVERTSRNEALVVLRGYFR